MQRVKKKHVLAALALGTSSFARAQAGARLVARYGEGGSATREVREMLGRRDAVPGGSKALLDFLQAWDTRHGDMPSLLRSSDLAPE
jgi:hypothetical protein